MSAMRLGERARRLGLLLRAPQLGAATSFMALRDLLGLLHAADAVAQVLQACHPGRAQANACVYSVDRLFSWPSVAALSSPLRGRVKDVLAVGLDFADQPPLEAGDV